MKSMNLNVRSVLMAKSPKRHLTTDFPSGLKELTTEEAKGIAGGESLAYWIGYAAGKIVRFFS